MRTPLVGLAAAVAAVALTIGSARGDRQGGAPPEPGLAALAPLPAPAPPRIVPEPLPGAGGGLAVVVARPTGVATGNFRPAITFSLPVVALGGVTEEAQPPPARIDPPFPGTWKWLGSATVEFVPEGALRLSTRYTVTVPAGLRAVDGSTLREPYTFSFETPRPQVQAVKPVPGSRWLTPRQTFALTMDQPVADLALRVKLTVGGEAWPLALTKETSLAAERAEAEAARARAEGRSPPAAQPGAAPSQDRRVRYELTPGRPLPADREVGLELVAGLRSAEGPLEAEPASWSFRTYGRLRAEGFSGCSPGDRCSYGPLLISTSNPVDVDSLRETLSIVPPVEVEWERVQSQAGTAARSPRLIVPGKFRPGTRYQVRLGPGWKDVHGQFGPESRGELTTSDLEPRFDLGDGVALLEAEGDGALPVETTNLTRLTGRVWSLDPSGVARLGVPSPGAARAEPPGVPQDFTLDVRARRNALRTQPLALRPFLGGKRTGLFLVEVEAPPELPEGWRRPQRVLGQLTDLAVHAKLGATSGVAWVTRLSTGKPVEGAALALHDEKGAVRWRGSTSRDGLAEVPGLATLGLRVLRSWDPAPFALLAATLGEDTGVTLSTWSADAGAHAYDLPTDWDGTAPRSLGAVFAERGVYRPGDTVHLKGIVRYRRLGRILAPPAKTALTLTVTSSAGKKLLERPVATTAYGTFSADVELPPDAPLGTFTVASRGKVASGPVEHDGSFRVEEYRSPRFRVDVELPTKDLVALEPLRGRVLARYLFGGAMSGAAVRWTVHRSTVAFEPPGNAGFSFGVGSWGWDDEAPAPSAGVFASGSGEADATGGAAIEAGVAEAPAGRTWEYTLEAEVADVDRQRISNRATVTVHPAALYAGVRRRSASFAEAGKEVVLEAVAATPGGAREAGVPLALQVKRREWRSIRKKGVGDRWSTLTEPFEKLVWSSELVSAPGPVACAFRPDRPGLYVVEVGLRDGRGRAQTTRMPFYVVGGGWVSWQRNDTDRLDLVSDKQRYAVGETARILVKSPYPEAEALLTVEREGVLSARRVHLSGAATSLEVPLGARAIPNVFVSVVLVRGRVPGEGSPGVRNDPGRPAVRIGYAQIHVEERRKRLEVAIAPERAVARPGEKVRVRVQVKDWRGHGTKAELAVWAVDEGVLRLTGYQVPDPVAMIHPPRGLSVRTGEPLAHLVLRRLYGEKGFPEGGSGGADAAGAGFRSRFQTTALYLPEVVTDASGRAEVELHLPDNLTTYRLMAVALTKGDRSGSGGSAITVSKPLLALPALPRVARVGDVFEAGVVVHAPSGSPRQVSVTAQASGLALESPATQAVTLDGGKAREVRFRFRADAPGEAVLRFQVAGGGERDGVEARLPVKLPVGMEAVAVYGDTRGARREALVPPGGVRRDVGGLEVTMASTALGGLAEGMRQLVDYPYGCLEQLSSRLVPFIALRELRGTFGVSLPAPGAEATHEGDPLAELLGGGGPQPISKARQPDEVVRRTVRAIEALQNGDGGYRYWDGSRCSSELGSAYAVLALGRAAEVGYPVDRAALARGQAFLGNVVAAGVCTRCGFGCAPPDDATRAFALDALARTGAPRASSYGELFARRGAMPLFGQALLADAMFAGGGDRGQARQLLAELLAHAVESPSEVHFQEADARTYAAAWSSDARTSAMVLQLLATVSPDHPYVPKLAAWLVRARRPDGSFRNTQESAWALMALTQVVRTRERETPDFVGRVSLGGKEIAQAPFRGRSLAVVRRELPMAQLPTGGKLPLDILRDGSAGILSYGVLLRYAPSVPPQEPLERGLTVQRWLEPYAGGGQVRAVRAGELLRVRVRVASHMARNFVAVEVPLPSGLEAVDTSLASTATLSGGPEEAGGPGYAYESAGDLSKPEDASPWEASFWSPFDRTEIRDDRVLLFADALPPGVHVASFVARATTPGTFLLVPARAEEMYAPEVFGRSSGGSFAVLDAVPVSAR